MAILDLATRRVMAWRLSNTMSTDFCIEALNEAITKYGAPEIFNTDQGSQFTSSAFTDVLKAHHVHISMDGKGRWVDNVFVERLWRRAVVSRLKGQWGEEYGDNQTRPHQSLDGKTPDEVYFGNRTLLLAA